MMKPALNAANILQAASCNEENVNVNVSSVYPSTDIQFMTSLQQQHNNNNEHQKQQIDVEELFNSSLLSDIIPTTIEDAQKLLTPYLAGHQALKSILKVLHISSALNAKKKSKLYIISVKMVQRKISTKMIGEVFQFMKCEESEKEPGLSECSRFLLRLPSTSIRLSKSDKGEEDVHWQRGDIPQFDEDGAVRIGIPELNYNEADAASSSQVQPRTTMKRGPTFSSNEYCRLLHVIADSRLIVTRQQIYEMLKNEQVEIENDDPFEDVAKLFNDITFKPERVDSLRGGITKSVIDCINPTLRPYERNAHCLNRKFRELRTEYDTVLEQYERYQQQDKQVPFSNFTIRAHIMYSHCLFGLYPGLTVICVRKLPQWEDEPEDDDDDDECSSAEASQSSKKRKRTSQESASSGISDIADLSKGKSSQVAQEIQVVQLHRAKRLAAEALAQATKSLLSAIQQATQMLKQCTTEDERNVYKILIANLLKQLGKI